MTGGVVTGGPVFVSYRQSDGKNIATELAWLLRAAGVPVWHDQTDLPPGDTEQRLDEALRSGLSGAVLLVTDELALSGVVRHVELPRLRELARDPDFVLAIANNVRKPDGSLDYDAPDRLLGLPSGSLGSFKQYPAYDRGGLIDLVRALVGFRASRYAATNAGTAGRPLHISIQTRARPTPVLPGGPDLRVLVRPGASGRLPSVDGLRDLSDALLLLPDSFRGTGATEVRLTGGAHLSAAFAFGAALPATLVGSLTVEGTDGVPWACGTVSATSDGLVYRISHGRKPIKAAGKPRDVIAFVELLPDTSAAAYARFLEDHTFADAWEYVRPAAAGRLDAAQGRDDVGLRQHADQVPARSDVATDNPVFVPPFIGSKVVKGISLEVEEGECVTLIGSNGAGKSTTLRSISGLTPPRTGEIRFKGRDIARMPAQSIVQTGISQSPEGRKCFQRMTVRENLDMGAYSRTSKAEYDADVERVFALFPRLKERRNQVAGTLSGGEQQMLATGRALMAHPTLLLMDEPSMGLAPVLVELIFATIEQINKEGVTILLVEQNALMALSVANRGYVLQSGTIVLQDTAANLKKDPTVQKAYLGME